jgi:hypothetical protein
LFVQSRGAAARRASAGVRRTFPIVLRPSDPVAEQDRTPPVENRHPTRSSRRTPSEAAPTQASLFYLGSVGLIAIGIIAVFFGTGFSLLASSVRGKLFEPAARSAAESVVKLPSPSVGRPIATMQPRSGDAAPVFAALPGPSGRPAASVEDGQSQPPQVGTSPPEIVRNTPAVSRPELEPRSGSAKETTSPGLAQPPVSPAELRQLLEHGDALLRTGDVISARLFYERAANAGDGRAALRLGATFDPAFLGRGGGKAHADLEAARMWYGRALDLGSLEAKGQLNSLDLRQGNNRE